MYVRTPRLQEPRMYVGAQVKMGDYNYKHDSCMKNQMVESNGRARRSTIYFV